MQYLLESEYYEFEELGDHEKWEYVEDYWPVRTSVGVPKYYAKFRND